MFNFVRKHKVLGLVVFLDLIAILVVILAIVLHQTKTATISFKVAPIDAEISINGRNIGREGTQNVSPGDYHVVISMEGMQSKELDVSLKDDEYRLVKVYLLDNDGGFSYYMRNPDELYALEQVADEEASKFVKEYRRLSAISEILPLTFSNTYDNTTNEIISISINWEQGGECKEKPFCLLITDLTGKNREKALSMIREAGYNPDDYELVFEDGMEE